MQCIIFAFDCIMHSLACLCIPSHFNRISNRMHLNAFDEIWKWVQMRLNASTCTRMWQGCGKGAGGGTGCYRRILPRRLPRTTSSSSSNQRQQAAAAAAMPHGGHGGSQPRAHPDILSLEGSIGGVGAEGAADMRRMHQHAYICCKMWKHVARCGHIPRPRTSPRRGPWSGSPAKRACFS